MQEDEILTAKFRSTLPFVLPLSLKTLHVQRARLISATSGASPPNSHCINCGCMSFRTRTVRETLKQKHKVKGISGTTKYLVRTCDECDMSTKTAVDTASIPGFSRRKKAQYVVHPTPGKSTPQTVGSKKDGKHLSVKSAPVSAHVPQQSSQDSRPSPLPKFSNATSLPSGQLLDSTTKKARSKKRGGLQELLSRNREQQKHAQERKCGGNSLGDFLSSLS
jgi:predicted nucleic-acid-binding Zn-ribbon protein